MNNGILAVTHTHTHTYSLKKKWWGAANNDGDVADWLEMRVGVGARINYRYEGNGEKRG